MGDAPDERLERCDGRGAGRPPIEADDALAGSLPETGEIFGSAAGADEAIMCQGCGGLRNADGAGVEAVAQQSGLRTVRERWLDVGMEYGLERLTDAS